MQNILIGKVETDPLIHYGGILNTFEAFLLLSFLSFVLFIPFIKEGRYKNFLFYIFSLCPLLNMYYRNYHEFVGGVFLGHLFYISGILLGLYIISSEFESIKPDGLPLLQNRKILTISVICIFVIRAIFLFGSRPTDSGIFSGIGGILYFGGSSMFRDYWGVVSIGSRYGPALYLSYLPFVPIAYITKYFLYGDALTYWNSVSDIPLAVATSYTGAIFYEGLIIILLIRMFKISGVYAAIIYMLNPLNSLILSVNANELPQAAFFLLGLYLIKRPLFGALSLVFSSMMKLYPVVCVIPLIFMHKGKERLRFVISYLIAFTLFFAYWLYEASLAPAELKTNPIRDILLYQKDPGKFHSIWYFVDNFFSPIISYIVIFVLIVISVFMGLKILRDFKSKSDTFVRLSALIFIIIILINRSIHPGYYYFLQLLLMFLFFLRIEEGFNNTGESKSNR